MILLRLFAEFFAVGLFAIGGGAATIPFLQDMSARTQWFTLGQLADMIAVAESTPGPIGVNMAAFAGYSTAGVAGAAAAPLGIIAPCVAIILIIARLLDKFRDSRAVKSVLYGLRPASAALIAAACLSIAKIVFRTGRTADIIFSRGNLLAAGLAAALIVAIRRIKAHPLVFIAVSALIGVIFEM
jgi:chromate transporter